MIRTQVGMVICLALRCDAGYNSERVGHFCRGVAQSVARHVRDVEVAGSNPVTPTNQIVRVADRQA